METDTEDLELIENEKNYTSKKQDTQELIENENKYTSKKQDTHFEP